jgi:hypothetical protein
MADWTMFKDPITTICAIVGAGLGVFNTLTGLSQRRVRLKVTPKLALHQPQGIYSTPNKLLLNGAPAIEILNRSAFAVTISEAGFKLKREAEKLIPKPPFIIDGKPWPRRLEAREAVTVYFPRSNNFPKNLGSAYATTSCGKTVHGDSQALKKFRAQLQQTAGQVERLSEI